MNILIAGGAGFIGSNSTHYFLDKGHRVTVVDNLLSGFYHNIENLNNNSKFTFIQLDICNRENLEKIFSNEDFDICINFAALVSVAESMDKPELTEKINVEGLLNLLDLGGKNGIKKFVLASSAAMYGDSQILPTTEIMAPEPKSPYAITKIAGEYYNTFYANKYGFEAINCRFFNVFGPRQSPQSQYAAAIPIFITRALKHDSITIFGDGEQVRDFIFIEDLISAIDYLIHTEKHDPLPFNLGYGKFISINELASLIIDISKSSSQMIHQDERAGDIKLSYASVERLRQLGWKEHMGFKKGLDKTIEWYKNNS